MDNESQSCLRAYGLGDKSVPLHCWCKELYGVRNGKTGRFNQRQKWDTYDKQCPCFLLLCAVDAKNTTRKNANDEN